VSVVPYAGQPTYDERPPTAAELAELEALASGVDPHAAEEAPPPTLRDRLLSLSDLATLPPVRPLTEGLVYRDTLAQLSGPPGSYKSFLALAMACRRRGREHLGRTPNTRRRRRRLRGG